ncbi:DUF1822 family protein [Pantanalinema rosaneae CENA516]|uniref:DUF1822 family protein n=1 Tax=Pantanalinema rosaneae TaxID=1620701 RepID=UPI003D6FC4E9
MTFDVPSPTLLDTHLYLEIPEIREPEAAFSTPGSRWRATLNQITLDTVLPWLRREYAPNAKVWRPGSLASLWDVVTGTAITVDGLRLVLVPTTAIDADELRVPQEWVDLPSWVADYYLAVQVNVDEGWLRIDGYTTHQRLKAQASYDANDRTYSLDATDLIQDVNVLWVTRELCPEETLRAEVSELPALPLAQAENLLKRLGNPAVTFPRLEVPFSLWGVLLEHGGWRQRLYELRQGLPEQWSAQQWLQAGISRLAQQLGWSQMALQPIAATGMRSAPESGWRKSQSSALVRELTIAGAPYELLVSPLEDELSAWRFELRPATADQVIPAGWTLRLLTEDLQAFPDNEDAATSDTTELYVEVAVEPGEGLVWEINPLPDDYDREVLRF